ncbi:hypothetical protein NDU88_005385 [Pleurodeles waltl]|uniref:Uncharacterized protein n=1 Tax=Pleurodeles waltl TaxID=8319 RepID=A0AAV7TVD1_PLEWA|nr:hypothetical protein NDU88_005385 [Pleurodeles waltl]
MDSQSVSDKTGADATLTTSQLSEPPAESPVTSEPLVRVHHPSSVTNGAPSHARGSRTPSDMTPVRSGRSGTERYHLRSNPDPSL